MRAKARPRKILRRGRTNNENIKTEKFMYRDVEGRNPTATRLQLTRTELDKQTILTFTHVHFSNFFTKFIKEPAKLTHVKYFSKNTISWNGHITKYNKMPKLERKIENPCPNLIPFIKEINNQSFWTKAIESPMNMYERNVKFNQALERMGRLNFKDMGTICDKIVGLEGTKEQREVLIKMAWKDTNYEKWRMLENIVIRLAITHQDKNMLKIDPNNIYINQEVGSIITKYTMHLDRRQLNGRIQITKGMDLKEPGVNTIV